MMDKDFDQLGKRLYDFEGDPPKDGWDKLGAALQIKQPTSRLHVIKKHWWKPLTIIVPVIIYLLLTKNILAPNQYLTSNQLVTEKEQLTDDEKGKNNLANNTENPINKNKNEKKDSHAIESSTKINAEIEKKSLQPIQERSIVSQADNRKHEITVKEKAEPINKTKNTHEAEVLNRSTASNTPLISVPANSSQVSDSTRIESLQAQSKKESLDKVNLSVSKEATEVKEVSNQHLVTLDPQQLNTKEKHISANDEKDIQADTSFTVEPNDTLTEEQIENSLIYQQSEDVNKSSKKLLPWRWSLMVAPQFLQENNAPVANDEIYVTGFERNKYPQPSGWNLAFGLGKGITEKFILDGQFTLTQSKQDAKLSYTDGAIDTLLALRQADQSIQVVPVYTINKKQIESAYTFAGFRLQGTYYFSGRSMRGFNISGALGMHYLINHRLREKTGTEWTALDGNTPNKINYTLSVGCGYNLALAPGWDLLINPSLNYYLKKVNNDALPYQFNQKSVGLNFMLSKTLAGKKQRVN